MEAGVGISRLATRELLLFDWLITLILTLTLVVFDSIILEKSAGSKSGVQVDICIV